jgi:hypothetical protein
MDDVKKKVLLDLFVSPWTVLPVAGGLSAWLLSWGIDGSTVLNVAGLAGVLGGIGMLATRLIFGLEDITHNAYVHLHEQQRGQQQAALDALDQRLSTDHDDRTQQCLRELRHLHGAFQNQVREGKITGSTHRVLDRVEQLFRACVRQLEQSYELWRTGEKLSGTARRSLLKERDEVVLEVVQTIEHLGKTIEQLHSVKVKQNESELARLREELDETMRVARRAEERMASLGKPEIRDQADYE